MHLVHGALNSISVTLIGFMYLQTKGYVERRDVHPFFAQHTWMGSFTVGGG